MKIRQFCFHILILAVGLAGSGCHRQHVNNLPPANMLMEPGPGVGGPGPGVMLGNLPTPVPYNISQIAFEGPDGMHVQHDTTGQGLFISEPLVVPGREDFPQGAIYRLKLTDVPGRPGEDYFPTLEVGPTTARTEAYLAHNAVPVKFTAQDFDQIKSGNFVTKVIYLPDPEYQQLALAAIETLVSTRLDPGVDPIQEADRRGSILAIVRLGNKILPSGAMANGLLDPNCPIGPEQSIRQVQYQQVVGPEWHDRETCRISHAPRWISHAPISHAPRWISHAPRWISPCPKVVSPCLKQRWGCPPQIWRVSQHPSMECLLQGHLLDCPVHHTSP